MQQWAPKRKFVGIALAHHNSLATQPEDVAYGLADHWAPVFSARPIDQNMLDWWMARIKVPEVQHIRWKITFAEFQEFIGHLRDSAAGPDGLVYGAYRYSPPFQKLLFLVILRF